MKPYTAPAPLTPSQIECVLELLECRELAPKETAARFDHLAKAGTFSEAQQEAIEILFALEEDEIPDALLEFADDEARDLVRHGLAHEARMSYVGRAARRSA
ncbi:hypothetical protein GCM10023165_16030 [Variovorax defluvii]|uniref:Uncharacterized protein n=1 Tax=Variovorax defluvii TaxID=913761 RepID=A0ABP8HDG8_9BURK